MNYIWDYLIAAKKQGIEKGNITFLPAKNYSPYMELSQELLNSSYVNMNVEVNPFYRFYDIFKDLFHPNAVVNEEFRDALFDIVIHLLAEIDLMQGMNKREYYIRFVLKDLEQGVFGKNIKQSLSLFSDEEKEIIALNILRLYQTNEELYFFIDTMKKIFKNSIIYIKSEEKEELLLYVGVKKTRISQQRVQLIQDIFLPIHFQVKFFWNYHFGMIAVDETMIIDKIALY